MVDADWSERINRFWFNELEPVDWYSGSPDLDERIRSRFGDLYRALVISLPPEALSEPKAALAAAIATDQFPRNMFRRSADAFGSDTLALSIARNAIEKEFDALLAPEQRQFLYLPLMHSEVHADQEHCVSLFRALGNADGIRYAEEHRDIIGRFGRFPHRNRALGRQTTEAEATFLKQADGYGQ